MDRCQTSAIQGRFVNSPPKLRDQCALYGATLVVDQVEDIPATRIQQIANELGATERTVANWSAPSDYPVAG
jgi:hypothetical protein